jgi:hypothetical protein
MPRTRRPKPTDIPETVLDHFAGPTRVMIATDIDDAVRRDKKALLERALGAELTHHLGYPPGEKLEAARNAATGLPPRLCSPTTARWTSRCRGIGQAPSRRS